ncbi:hypothetical protein bcf_12735 [Bacillus cereus F837/76]|uniref:Uncharacterized protein n=1 Tax=Bacillus cereus (strain 03BB102) TaxID=572264 RepID=A0A158RNF6_BACC3|nr:hypothetical protein BCA_2628 [Bacillus cereus 03BB102]AEW55669.1 hypothetical protein bcf_12735 [Bacillus cereus F837/76]EDX64597.1 hypothetical protein BC03BB108_2471 [Bacillus cereus 03BB108]EDX67374.1 hypothetical protein BC059799_2499 [Bacillus cereus NVH0597-99]EEK56302.1 hypothetical protein bcere0004_23300 [Bacillus cereus BGSC 6E1]PYD97027.1 hypothetical protein CR195_019305 [Bacillus cereus]
MIRNQGFREIALDFPLLLILFTIICSRKCICFKETSQNIKITKSGFINAERLAGGINSCN